MRSYWENWQMLQSISINKIYKHSYSYEIWDKIILSSKKEYHFLFLVRPLMAHLFNYFKNIRAKYPKLTSVLNDPLFISLIYIHFITQIHMMIIRTCVLEMRVASKNHLLIGKTPEERFDYFIKILRDPEQAIDLLNKYTILKKQLAININQLENSLTELFARLNNDYDELVSEFLTENQKWRIIHIQLSGDKHQQGRGVTILTFQNNKNKSIKIVYKPRSLDIDIAFQKYILWLNKKTQHLKLATIKILNKKNYGWCEFIEFKACQSKKQIKHFYYRLGILLMLTYSLRSLDLHSENIIANGENPFIVDYECLLSPMLIEEKSFPRFFVTNMILLPSKIVINKEHKGLDISGMGSEEGGESLYSFIEWADIGKDTMHANRIRTKSQSLQNRPSFGKKNIDYLKYTNEFLNGFEETYHLILNYFPPLKLFKNKRIRLVFRATSIYFKLLFESWHPRYVFDAKERKKHFNQLKQKIDQFPVYKKILKSEIDDLNQQNIPFFTSLSSSKKIVNTRGKVLNIPIYKSGYEAVLTHFKYINEKDLLLQKNLIINSFEAAEHNKGKSKNFKYRLPNIHAKNPLPLAELKSKALLIAKRELDKLIDTHHVNKEFIFWPTLYLTEDLKLWTAGSTSIDLYNGLAGIVLSFVYGAEVLKNPKYVYFAKQGIKGLHQFWTQMNPAQEQEIGAFNGIGSSLYTLSAFYRLNKDKNIKKLMQKLLFTIPKNLDNDKELDILSGAAGCLAVIMSLQDIFSKKIWLPCAKACVNHILKMYPKPNQLDPDRKISATQPMLGFSHGTTGIAYALSQYYYFEPRHDIKKWIDTALKYERAEFNEQMQNWPDYRSFNQSGKNSQFMTAWCHGAPGIGLARLDMLDRWQDNEFKHEIHVALETTKKTGFEEYQCLCHGCLGNLELFLYASQVLKDPKITEEYRQIASAVINYLEKQPFRLSVVSNEASPGLMIGRAGIAYQMLRIAAPEKVPSVLLLKNKF